jgi:hypothetical protein
LVILIRNPQSEICIKIERFPKMKIHQLSLFLENRAGQLRHPVQLLAQAGIDIRTLMLADTQQFGILRIIVQDWQRAKQALEAGGVVVNVTEVVACEVADRPGGLDEILAVVTAKVCTLTVRFTCTHHGQTSECTEVGWKYK